MIAFTKRNLKVYLRDRATVVLSLLTSLIMIGLYILFLGDVYATNLPVDNAREVMDRWVMAGLLATTSGTTTLGAFSAMVSDRARKLSRDFYASPVKRSSLAGGYACSVLAIGYVTSVITLIVMEIYLVAKGWAPLSAAAWVRTLLLLLLTVFANAAISFFIAVFFASANAFSTASIIFGTLIGFLTGIYLPIGMLPEGVQWAIRLFPPSHAAALLRQMLMERVIEARLGALPEQAVTEIKHLFGITLQFGTYEFSRLASCLFLIACALVLFSLAAWRLSRQNK